MDCFRFETEYEIKEKHEDKIYEVKGTGILNGIVFKSFLNEIANIIEKLQARCMRSLIMLESILTQ